MPESLPPHVAWLGQQYGDALRARMAGEGIHMPVEDALRVLVAADPSPRLHGVDWLCKTYLGSGYRWEDVAGGAESKACGTLRLFGQHRRHLARSQRNLASHASLATVYAAILPLLAAQEVAGTASGRELRRQQRAGAHEESLILCQRPDLMVAVPMTQGAAKWWGRGTQWCTAADGYNMFEEYHRRAPLIVVVLPDVLSDGALHRGAKLQLHIDPESGEVQFMDATDAAVDIEFICLHWNLLESLVMWGLEQSACMLEYVPPQYRSHMACMQAVARNGTMLGLVPPHLLDAELCMAAVHQRPRAIQHVPAHLLSTDIYRLAIQLDGNMLSHVPSYMKTGELCKLAVQNNGMALQHVEDKTYEMCLDAAGSASMVLSHVPMDMRTPELYRRAVMAYPHTLSYKTSQTRVPREYLDEDFYVELVSRHPWSLRLVEEQTHAICLAAIQADGMALQCAQSQFVDADMCWTAIQSSTRDVGEFGPGSPLQHVPHQYLDQVMCRAAVERAGVALRYVPQDLQDKAMCTLAIGNNPAALLYADRQYIDEEMCHLAIQGDGVMLQYVPAEYATERVCRAAVTDWQFALKHVPRHMRTVELCVLALQCSPLALEYVPPDLLDQVRALVPTLGRAECNWTPEVALAGLEGALVEKLPVHPVSVPPVSLPPMPGLGQSAGLARHG